MAPPSHPDSPAALDQLFVDFQSALAGRYSLEREVGRGGMGIVYLAREVRLDRPVAIKLLPPAKLSHPNIIPIYAVDDVAEFVFFAMAYVEGETLTERVRARGPLPPAEGARVLREIAWGLAYAHAHGVIHRDVKPDNILLERSTGRALIADFGIAGLVRGAAGLDGGEVIGTPEFMSPEQGLGETVDARSDLYGLGATAYFALAGRLPFTAPSAAEVLALQVTGSTRPLLDFGSGVPRRLARLVDSCLAKSPEERPPSAEELAERLGSALEQRREVPVPLRVFVRQSRGFGCGTALLYGYMLLLGAAAAAGLLGPAAALGIVLGGVALVPVLFAWQARRVVRLGYGPDDVAFAFQWTLDQGREERAFQYGVRPRLWERILGGIGVGGLVVGITALGIGAESVGVPSFLVGMLSGLLAVWQLQRRRDLGGEFWHKFWKGRIGRWLFRQATRFGSGALVAGGATHRPTELSLGMAAEQLFARLPKEARQQLRDLPDVVHRLEEDARRMRGRLEELQEAGIGEGRSATTTGTGAIDARRDRIAADLSAERDLVQQRLSDAVAALETIRLNLLRLHAGAASVQSVTTDLGLAKDVAREMDLLLQSRKELEDDLQ